MANNLLFLIATPGTPAVIPGNFQFASINPATDASYTITNSLDGNISGVGLTVSSAIEIPFTFPDPPNQDGWGEHTITATGGDVLIAYSNGI